MCVCVCLYTLFLSSLLQVARPPIITDCSNRAVNERTISGSAIGGPILATNPNIGTSLVYSLNYTLSTPSPPNVPLSIGLCDGQLRVLKTFLWRDYKQFTVFITVRNDGSAIGIGSSTSTCIMRVNVTQVRHASCMMHSSRTALGLLMLFLLILFCVDTFSLPFHFPAPCFTPIIAILSLPLCRCRCRRS